MVHETLPDTNGGSSLVFTPASYAFFGAYTVDLTATGGDQVIDWSDPADGNTDQQGITIDTENPFLHPPAGLWLVNVNLVWPAVAGRMKLQSAGGNVANKIFLDLADGSYSDSRVLPFTDNDSFSLAFDTDTDVSPSAIEVTFIKCADFL